LTIGTFAVDDQGSQDIMHKFFAKPAQALEACLRFEEAAVYHIACSRLFTPDQGAIRRAIFVNNAGMNYLAIQSFEKAEPAYVEAIHLGIFEQDKPLDPNRNKLSVAFGNLLETYSQWSVLAKSGNRRTAKGKKAAVDAGDLHINLKLLLCLADWKPAPAFAARTLDPRHRPRQWQKW
jgi:hypothetical protein